MASCLPSKKVILFSFSKPTLVHKRFSLKIFKKKYNFLTLKKTQKKITFLRKKILKVWLNENMEIIKII